MCDAVPPIILSTSSPTRSRAIFCNNAAYDPPARQLDSRSNKRNEPAVRCHELTPAAQVRAQTRIGWQIGRSGSLARGHLGMFALAGVVS